MGLKTGANVRPISELPPEERQAWARRSAQGLDPFWARVYEIMAERPCGWARALAQATDEEKARR